MPPASASFLTICWTSCAAARTSLSGRKNTPSTSRRLEKGDLPVPRVTKSKDADALLDSEVIERCREIASVFTTVEGMLNEQNLGTFGHMITKAHDLLRDDDTLLAEEQAQTKFILVDEFQDANFAQVKILRSLAGSDRNIFAVGDPDQAIYRFRGASSAAFSLFQRNFPDARLVVLGKNRRSTTSILQCAFSLVNENPSVVVKDGSLSLPQGGSDFGPGRGSP